MLTLRERREKKGLLQAQVARVLEVSEAAVCQWEKNKNRILPKYQKKLAKLYGCTVEDLLAGLEEPKSET